MNIKLFTFNPFQENTYILYDETGECMIVDPGCDTEAEQNVLRDFIETNRLTPTMLVNTHCHIDHVLGNRYIHDLYILELHAHKGEKPVLEANVAVASMYGMPYTPSPPITRFLEEGVDIHFGKTTLEVLFTPGHSPASISMYHRASRQLIVGDVLFNGSIGRTDLPGGNYDTLIDSIRSKYYPLGDDIAVYPGHGPSTTLFEEKMRNPFLQ